MESQQNIKTFRQQQLSNKGFDSEDAYKNDVNFKANIRREAVKERQRADPNGNMTSAQRYEIGPLALGGRKSRNSRRSKKSRKSRRR
jgi:hypothetical protein